MSTTKEIITTKQVGETNLLSARPVDATVRSRYFPLVLQIGLLVLFLAALYDGFFGNQSGDENLITFGVWTLFFWPVVLITLVLVGKAWCAVCPVGSIAGAMNRFNLGLRWPQTLSTVGLSVIAFVVVLWIVRPLTDFDQVPSETAWFFLIVASLAAATGLLFSDRIFCRYVCPITANLRVISSVSLLFLRVTGRGETRTSATLESKPGEVDPNCRDCATHPCFKGDSEIEGCPWGLYPAAMDTLNRNCSLCMKCVKSCSSPGTIKLKAAWPFSRLARIFRPTMGEAFAILALMSIFLFHMAWGHGPRTPTFIKDAGPEIFPMLSADDAVFVTVELLGLAVIIGLYSAVALVSSRMLGVNFRNSFVLFIWAYLPLFVFRALGYLTQDLLRHGGEILTYVTNFVGLHAYFDPEVFPGFSEPIFEGTRYNVYSIFFTIPILLGLLVGAYVLYRIARSIVTDRGQALRLAAPHLALMTVIVLVLYEYPYLVGWKVLPSPDFLYG